MSEPKTSKQTIYGTWEEADEIPYYPNVFERIWNWITKRTNANQRKKTMRWMCVEAGRSVNKWTSER